MNSGNFPYQRGEIFISEFQFNSIKYLFFQNEAS